MSSTEDREKHKRRRTNSIAKDLRDPNGKYRLRVHDPRKGEYKRIRLDPKEIELEIEVEEDDNLDRDPRWPFSKEYIDEFE